MKLSLPYQLVRVLCALVASISLVGAFNYIAALGHFRSLPPDVPVEWSGYLVALAQIFLALLFSVVGFLGVLLGTPPRARLCALVFCGGYGLLICARWVALAAGATQFPGWAGASLSVALLVALVGLVAALRPSNSIERARIPRAA